MTLDQAAEGLIRIKPALNDIKIDGVTDWKQVNNIVGTTMLDKLSEAIGEPTAKLIKQIIKNVSSSLSEEELEFLKLAKS